MNQCHTPAVGVNASISPGAAGTEPDAHVMPWAADGRTNRANDCREIDIAFLQWLEARLTDSGPDACEEHLVNYLIALTLNEIDSRQ
jgi:hypothetical protein